MQVCILDILYQAFRKYLLRILSFLFFNLDYQHKDQKYFIFDLYVLVINPNENYIAPNLKA